MSDLKTLRASSIQLSAELLDRYLRYQRVLLTALATQPKGDWAGRFAFAHGQAAGDCGLDALALQKVKAVVTEFCGKRSAWLTVQQRVVEAEHAVAEAKAHGKAPPARDAALLDRARAELPGLADLRDFGARYGAEAVALLTARELELVTLHRELARLEGGGHVHPRPSAPG